MASAQRGTLCTQEGRGSRPASGTIVTVDGRGLLSMKVIRVAGFEPIQIVDSRGFPHNVLEGWATERSTAAPGAG
jgi:hypothetical protein